jgi:hypothetical protein
MYVIVFDHAKYGRNFVIDPDGVVLCGTTADFRLAQWTFDAQRTQQTSVAPGTDILAGLAMIRGLLPRES